MEDFTKLDCGCYVGFDVYHKPMWGKQCPLHEASREMYEALKLVDRWGAGDGVNSATMVDAALLALSKAERR